MDNVRRRQSRLDQRTALVSRFLIWPRSTFRTSWDIMLVVLVLYNAFALPFIVCFRVDLPYAVTVVEQCIDAVFYMDLLINFITTYEVKGHLVLDHRTVAWHYATHWFIVDLIATFPFDQLAGGNHRRTQSLRLTLLRGIKCVRLVRLARLFKFLEKIEFVSHFLKLFRLFFGFSVVAHWMACMWYLIGEAGLDYGSVPEGWMVAYNQTGWNVYEKSHVSAYITSLYWTVTTLLTVGYGDISAHTTVEKAFALVTMVFGALISATIFGNVTMLIESLGRSESAHREKMESVEYYMVDLGLPSELQLRIRDFYSLLWARNKTFGSDSVLAELPPSFQHEIASYLNQDLFDKCMIFTDSNPVFLRHLASKLKFCVSLPNDDIIREGEQADKIYFLRKGSCLVSSEAHGKLTVLKDGGYFGDIGLLGREFMEEFGIGSDGKTDVVEGPHLDALPPSPSLGGITTSPATTLASARYNKRTASVTALVNCDLYYLADADFMSLLRHFPQYHRLFLLISLVRFKQREYHDDEDIIQKIFLMQVMKKELRLRYHEKVKIRKTPTAVGPPTKRGSRKSPAADASDDIAHTENDVDTFEESTQDLIRRVSLIGLEPAQAAALRQKHEALSCRPTIAALKKEHSLTPPSSPSVSRSSNIHETSDHAALPTLDLAASQSDVFSPVAEVASAPTAKSTRPVRALRVPSPSILPEVEEEDEEGRWTRRPSIVTAIPSTVIAASPAIELQPLVIPGDEIRPAPRDEVASATVRGARRVSIHTATSSPSPPSAAVPPILSPLVTESPSHFVYHDAVTPTALPNDLPFVSPSSLALSPPSSPSMTVDPVEFASLLARASALASSPPYTAALSPMRRYATTPTTPSRLLRPSGAGRLEPTTPTSPSIPAWTAFLQRPPFRDGLSSALPTSPPLSSIATSSAQPPLPSQSPSFQIRFHPTTRSTKGSSDQEEAPK